MTTIIRAQGFKLTPAIRKHLENRFERALDDFGDDVSRVEVFIGDLNGPTRGGSDKSVRVDARLPGLAPVTVESVSDDLYAAIASAAKRTRRAVGRAVGRRHRVRSSGNRRLRLPHLGIRRATASS